MEQDNNPPGGGEASVRGIQTRQTILNAAKELVARKGANGTTVRDITAASGANTAAVNYHFQSKEALVRRATEEITGDVNRARLAQLDALEAQAQGAPLAPRDILAALVQPILEVSRAEDGGSLYLRTIFHMRVDARVGYDSFGSNQHVARRFIDAIARAYPALSREEAVWHYEFARGAAIHLLANLDPVSRRIERLHARPGAQLPKRPSLELNGRNVERVIELILRGFGSATPTGSGPKVGHRAETGAATAAAVAGVRRVRKKLTP